MKQYRLLMLTTLIISGCSMVYELIISAVSSYLLGDSTLQYSITIGLYMCAMGLGSFLSRFFRRSLFAWFTSVELAIGVLGSASSLILFLSNLYIESYSVVMYILIIAIGVLVGAEIPLLARIIQEDNGNLRLTLSAIFSFDYIGGLIGAVAFPIIMLPHLGYFATSFLTGSFNLLCALLIIIKYGSKIKNHSIFLFATLFLMGLSIFGMIFSENISNFIEGGLYRDDVILSEQTKYQKIVVTKHKDDLRLYIDGNVQFSSADEYRYHEALVHIPMSYAKNKDNVLILGGGDGLAARELLKYPETKITLVDLDKGMTDLCSKYDQITRLNKDSLTNERVTVLNTDAYKYLEGCKEKYDVVIVDLPDPNNESLNRLYSNIFYRLCKRVLKDGGILNVQSTSPYYAPKAFWCINRTIQSEGFNVRPYHLQVPAFGDWGFNLASTEDISSTPQINVDTEYLNDPTPLFYFAKDELASEKDINSLTHPVLMSYYNKAVEEWND